MTPEAWLLVLVLHMPSLCDTESCRARQGEIHAEVRAVDEAHCLRLRKNLARQFGGMLLADGEIVGLLQGTHVGPCRKLSVGPER